MFRGPRRWAVDNPPLQPACAGVAHGSLVRLYDVIRIWKWYIAWGSCYCNHRWLIARQSIIGSHGCWLAHWRWLMCCLRRCYSARPAISSVWSLHRWVACSDRFHASCIPGDDLSVAPAAAAAAASQSVNQYSFNRTLAKRKADNIQEYVYRNYWYKNKVNYAWNIVVLAVKVSRCLYRAYRYRL